MKSNEIRALVELRGEDLTQVATVIGVSLSRVSDTINYKRRNKTIRLKLARHFNLPVERLFDQPLAAPTGRHEQSPRVKPS
jgi:antitoxin component HigA of HigAB toxin-antitoxin module